jgi:hypothetical protein
MFIGDLSISHQPIGFLSTPEAAGYKIPYSSLEKGGIYMF